MKKVILYNLQDGAYQPYEQLVQIGDVNFEGGLTKHGDDYLGILDGAEESINTFLADNVFNTRVITNEQAIEFFSQDVKDFYLPDGTIITRQSQIDSFIAKL